MRLGAISGKKQSFFPKARLYQFNVVGCSIYTTDVVVHEATHLSTTFFCRQDGRTSGHEKRGLSFRRAITLFETSEP